MNNTLIDTPHTFYIYKANGEKKDGLKKAFVARKFLLGNELEINHPDKNTTWPIYFEGKTKYPFPAEYIISFQVYEDKYFAVARLYNEPSNDS